LKETPLGVFFESIHSDQGVQCPFKRTSYKRV